MISTPEPFLSAEVAYRQQHLAELYSRRGSRAGQRPTPRRHWVPRRPTLTLPPSGRRLVALAFGD